MGHDASNVIKGRFILWGTGSSGDGTKNQQDVTKMKGPVGSSLDVGDIMSILPPAMRYGLGKDGSGEAARDRAKDLGSEGNTEDAVSALKGSESETAIKKADDKTVVDTIYLTFKASNGGMAYRTVKLYSNGDTAGLNMYTGVQKIIKKLKNES